MVRRWRRTRQPWQRPRAVAITLASQWLATVTDPAEWEDIFDGKVDLNPACLRADQLAAQNDGQVQTCDDPVRWT